MSAAHPLYIQILVARISSNDHRKPELMRKLSGFRYVVKEGIGKGKKEKRREAMGKKEKGREEQGRDRKGKEAREITGSEGKFEHFMKSPGCKSDIKHSEMTCVSTIGITHFETSTMIE